MIPDHQTFPGYFLKADCIRTSRYSDGISLGSETCIRRRGENPDILMVDIWN